MFFSLLFLVCYSTLTFSFHSDIVLISPLFLAIKVCLFYIRNLCPFSHFHRPFYFILLVTLHSLVSMLITCCLVMIQGYSVTVFCVIIHLLQVKTLEQNYGVLNFSITVICHFLLLLLHHTRGRSAEWAELVQ